MTILGVIASSTRQGLVTDTGAMFPIGAFTLTAATASITFSNIPQTYTHLQLRVFSQRTDANGDGLLIRFNGDSSSNYYNHYMNSNGSAISTGPVTGGIWNTAGYLTVSAGTSANAFAGSVCDILDYKNTSKVKVTKSIYGWSNNGSGEAVGSSSSRWNNTAAITSITLLDPSTNLNTYSSYALYGIKGA